MEPTSAGERCQPCGEQWRLRGGRSWSSGEPLLLLLLLLLLRGVDSPSELRVAPASSELFLGLRPGQEFRAPF